MTVLFTNMCNYGNKTCFYIIL